MTRRPAPNLLDRIAGFISPRWGLQRIAARNVLGGITSATRRTGAAKKGTLANWTTNRLSRITEALERRAVQERADDLVANDAHAASLVGSMSVHVAGSGGLVPQASVPAARLGWSEDQANAWNAECEYWFSAWADTDADAGGRLSFSDLQHLSVYSLLARGEFIRIPVQLPTSPRREFSTAIQMIAPSRLSTPSDRMADPVIRDGVELGLYGQPLAYHIANPERGWTSPILSSAQYVRIPAWRGHRPGLLHGFRPTEEEQVRGISVLAPALKTFKDMGDYLDFELVGAIVANNFPVWIEQQNPYSIVADGETAEGREYQEFEPGNIYYGANGQRPHILKSDRPGDSFEPFVMRMARIMGAAAGMPYEIISKDFSQTNYSSARAALLEAYRTIQSYQIWLVSALCRPIWRLVIEECFLRGRLKLPKSAPDFYDQMRAYTACRWIPPRRGHVDPVKEAKAAVLLLENDLSTLAEQNAELGGDWEARMRQRARERRLKQALDPTPQNDQPQEENNA